MIIKESLREQPNHKHYSACLQKKLEIKKYTSVLAIAVPIICMIIAIFAFAGVDIPLFANFASAFTKNDIVKLVFEIVGLVLLAVLSFLGNVVDIVYDFVLLIVFALMLIFSFFNLDSVNNFLVMAVIAGGCGVSLKSFESFFNWRQLEQTEGFPQFSHSIAYFEENVEYKATKEVYASDGGGSEMIDLKPVEPMRFTGNESKVQMEEPHEIDDLQFSERKKSKRMPTMKFTEVDEIEPHIPKKDTMNEIDMRE